MGQWYEVTGTFGTQRTGRNCTAKRRRNSMKMINLFRSVGRKSLGGLLAQVKIRALIEVRRKFPTSTDSR